MDLQKFLNMAYLRSQTRKRDAMASSAPMAPSGDESPLESPIYTRLGDKKYKAIGAISLNQRPIPRSGPWHRDCWPGSAWVVPGGRANGDRMKINPRNPRGGSMVVVDVTGGRTVSGSSTP